MNGLDGIAKFYKEQVDERDEKGFANLFKKAAQKLFKTLKKEGFTVTKPQYLDGYFIFGYGTNSVVHFHIKEIPGWKFGIWWEEPKLEEGKSIEYINGELFAQFEETIDKFKPSASSITEQIYVSLKNPVDYWYLTRKLTFMRDEPEICFCKDYCWDEWEYHTRAEAKQKFKEYKKKQALQTKYEEKFKQKYLEWAKAVCKYLGKGAKVVDKGDNWSPRYDIVCKMPNKKFDVDEPGCYGLFDDDVELDEGLKALKKQWDKLEKEVDKVNNTTDAYIFYTSYFHPSVNMYEPKESK